MTRAIDPYSSSESISSSESDVAACSAIKFSQDDGVLTTCDTDQQLLHCDIVLIAWVITLAIVAGSRIDVFHSWSDDQLRTLACKNVIYVIIDNARTRLNRLGILANDSGLDIDPAK